MVNGLVINEHTLYEVVIYSNVSLYSGNNIVTQTVPLNISSFSIYMRNSEESSWLNFLILGPCLALFVTIQRLTQKHQRQISIINCAHVSQLISKFSICCTERKILEIGIVLLNQHMDYEDLVIHLKNCNKKRI